MTRVFLRAILYLKFLIWKPCSALCVCVCFAGRTSPTGIKSLHFLSVTHGPLTRQHLNHSPTPVKISPGTYGNFSQSLQSDVSLICTIFFLYNEKKVEAAQCLAELPDSRSRTAPAPPPPAPTSGSPTREKGPRNGPYLGQSQPGLVPARTEERRPSTFEAEDAQMGGSHEGKLSGDLIVHFLRRHPGDRKVFVLLYCVPPSL